MQPGKVSAMETAADLCQRVFKFGYLLEGGDLDFRVCEQSLDVDSVVEIGVHLNTQPIALRLPQLLHYVCTHIHTPVQQRGFTDSLARLDF